MFRTVDTLRTQRVLLGFSAVCLVGTIVLLVLTPPADGLEVSISEGLPELFWILLWALFTSIALSLLLAGDTNQYKIQSILLLLTAWIVFLSLPVFRGYFHYGLMRADIFAHLGFTKTIIDTGKIGEGDFYPIIHVLMAILEQIGVDYWDLRYFLSITFVPALIISFFIFIRELTASARVTFCIMAIATVPLYKKFYLTVQPAFLSFCLIPYLFWALERYRRGYRRSLYVMGVIVLSTAFAHPVSASLLLIAISTYTIVGPLLPKIQRYLKQPQPSISSNQLIVLGLLGFVVLFLWLTSITRMLQIIAAHVAGLLIGSDITALSQIDTATGRGLTTEQIVIRFLELYGPPFIIGLLAACVLIYLGYRVISKRQITSGDVLATSHYLVGVAMAVTLVTIPFGVGSPVRHGRYGFLFLPVIIGIGLGYIFELPSQTANRKRVVTTGLILLVVFAFVLPIALLNVYEPRTHTTYSEYQGAKWTVENHDRSEQVYSLDINVRFEDAILGRHVSRSQPWTFFGRYSTNRPDLFPPRLGYNQNEEVVKSFGPGYLVTKENDMRYTEALFDTQVESGQFTFYRESDLERLHNDRSAGKLYTNGEWQTWQMTN